MTKRIFAATAAVVLGILASVPADARPANRSGDHQWRESHSDDDDDDRVVVRKHRRHATAHRRTRLASREGSRRSMRSRSVTRHAGDGAGTSRGCLRPTARALLGRIEAKFGHVQIISTCRPGARIAGSGRPSKHASGEAIDFNAPRGRKGEVVRWLIANHKSGGTMTYADMNHIHVDVGYHFIALNSGSGR